MNVKLYSLFLIFLCFFYLTNCFYASQVKTETKTVNSFSKDQFNKDKSERLKILIDTKSKKEIKDMAVGILSNTTNNWVEEWKISEKEVNEAYIEFYKINLIILSNDIKALTAYFADNILYSSDVMEEGPEIIAKKDLMEGGDKSISITKRVILASKDSKGKPYEENYYYELNQLLDGKIDFGRFKIGIGISQNKKISGNKGYLYLSLLQYNQDVFPGFGISKINGIWKIVLINF